MMMLGLDHVGVGVADMEEAISFYGDLGFTDLAFDYGGPLPGMAAIAGRDVERARVVMLRSNNPTSLGTAAIKLVQTGDVPAPPLPDGIAWGERGVCEVAIHAREPSELHRWLVEERGAANLMSPVVAQAAPTSATFCYIADPNGGKVELIELSPLVDGWPGPSGPQGVNHVAIGIGDMARAVDFYRRLGFVGTLLEIDDYNEPMHPWYPGPPPRQHLAILVSPYGGWLELVQLDPPSADMRGDWGHLGPMDFGIGVRDLDLAIDRLGAAGVEFTSAPQTVAVDGGTWRYVYVTEPDGNYAALCEARY